jgi:hypothetical protein
MRPTKADHTVVSTLDGKHFQMGIDESALQHIIGVLTDLYSDPEMAVLREYATNARDSHIEAGKGDVPIEITLPTTLAPFLKIKDRGVGLDAYEVEHIYSRYGTSTKRESDDATGLLGLGCKSALTYTNQFTLVAIKDGVKTHVAVSRDENGVGSMTIVDIAETDEENGVEVVVPVKSYNEFGEKAERLFRFWPKGSVLVNGEEPEKIEGLKVTEGIYLTQQYRESYVVMGNVPYHVDTYQFNFDLPYGWSIVAYVPMGAIHFTPSREELQFTATTKAALAKVKELYQAGIVEAIQRDIDAAPDFVAGAKAYLKWYEFVPSSAKQNTKFTYKGTEVPEQIQAADGSVFYITETQKEYNRMGKPWRVSAHSKYNSVNLGYAVNAVWVKGFSRNFTAACKKRLWKYCEQHGIDVENGGPKYFILADELPKVPWLPKPIRWAKVEQIKLPRAKRADGSPAGPAATYNTLVYNGDSLVPQELEEDEVDISMPIYYMVEKEYRKARQQASILSQLEESFTLIYITANREKKLLRLFPQAQRAATVIAESWRWWYETYLSDFERELLSLHTGNDAYYVRRSTIYHLPLVGINDPVICEVVRLYRDPKLVATGERLSEQAKAFGEYRRIQKIDVDNMNNVLTPYPLCGNFPHYGDEESKKQWREHAALYINAIYAQNNNGTKGR